MYIYMKQSTFFVHLRLLFFEEKKILSPDIFQKYPVISMLAFFCLIAYQHPGII